MNDLTLRRPLRPLSALIRRLTPVSRGLGSLGFRFLCAAFLIGCLLPGASLAQEQDQDEDTDAQQLPEIAPREIEIRGELQLSFPSLERQPLVGFTSPPTVPSVPEGRLPYTEPYKQELDELPDSLPTPTTVSESATTVEAPKQGFIEMGAGRYVSRFAEARLSFPVGSRQTVSLHTDYRGSAGFSPFSGMDVQTPYDAVEGTFRFESRHDPITVAADLHGMVDSYTLYGIPAVQQTVNTVAPSRTGASGGTTLSIRSTGAVTSSARLTLDRTQYNTEATPTPQTDTDAFHETRIAIDGRGTLPIGQTSTNLTVAASRSTFGGDVPETSGYTVDGGLTARLLETDFISFDAGGQVLTFSTPARPTQSTTGTATASFFAPRGRLALSLTPKVTIYGENAPGLDETTLKELYSETPYVEHAPSLRPTLSTTNAESGVLLSLGALRIQTVAGYRYAPSYRYVRSPDPTGLSATEPMQVEYGSARIVRGGAEVGLQGVNGVEASVSMFARNGELVGRDTDIPYLSPLVGNAMLSVSFADRRGLVQVYGSVESPRPARLSDNSEVGTYVSFDVEGSYEVSSLLDLVIQVQNVSPQAPEKWAGYVRPPTALMGGIRIHW